MPSLRDATGLPLPVLRQPAADANKRPKTGGGRAIFKMFKLLPMLTSGCKMVALLRRPGKALLGDKGTTVTLFGYRRGRMSLAIQEDPHSPPTFLIELPMLTTTFHKEMASGLVKVALESETRMATTTTTYHHHHNRRKLVEEYVWAVYCNGRKSGYSVRRKQASDVERYVLQLLRGVSMGAGVLPCPSEKVAAVEGELTYMRARFERVVGSKDSEALYMINPDGTGGPELSIFLVRLK